MGLVLAKIIYTKEEFDGRAVGARRAMGRDIRIPTCPTSLRRVIAAFTAALLQRYCGVITALFLRYYRVITALLPRYRFITALLRAITALLLRFYFVIFKLLPRVIIALLLRYCRIITALFR